MEPDDLLCSRSARPPKTLKQAWKEHACRPMRAGKDTLAIPFIGGIKVKKGSILAACSKIPPARPLAGFFSRLLKTGGLPIDHPHPSQDQCDAEDFTHAYGFVQ
jgi:hypothetical protein